MFDGESERLDRIGQNKTWKLLYMLCFHDKIVVSGGENTMSTDKDFLTYNQQMRKLRDKKNISCNGSKSKIVLARMGYFNLINGYKKPFICGTDPVTGDHIYLPNTSIEHFYCLKTFDDDLRILLLKYITQVEEEVRTLTGYKFDQCNGNGKIQWFDIAAYSPNSTMQSRMNAISSAYSELSKSHLEYVKFYMDNHTSIPTWIMIKVVNFSTFINVLNNSKTNVKHSICRLYDMTDAVGHYDVKLLIGSLHWLRKVRNSCAHNERIYCIRQSPDGRVKTGRILEKYFRALRPSYSRESDKRIMDLLVYMKYYLPNKEYVDMISEVQEMLKTLENAITPNAFDNIRGQMGIKNLSDLEDLKTLPKAEIQYNKFDTF